MYRIFPSPKQCTFYHNTLSCTSYGSVTTAPEIEESCRAAGFDPAPLLASVFPGGFSPEGITLTAEYVSCAPEGFQLNIAPSSIRISCGDGAGFFYALGVLVQLAAQAGGTLPCAEIADEPVLSVRGIMLDIGRDKIPAMETLRRLIDLFASMRINHLQMYMEGFSFDYEDFHYLFTNETPMTPAEFRELSCMPGHILSISSPIRMFWDTWRNGWRNRSFAAWLNARTAISLKISSGGRR